MSRSLMFVGTSSESGKSIMATAFCRILKKRGVRVAPFKAQNMALNSYVTRDGKEMGRAQVVQAEAAGLEPDVDMNPILLKPSSEMGSQVIVQGIVQGTMEAAGYYAMKKLLWPKVTESYDRLAAAYDCVVLEGAGSPVEMNLKENDIVNMAMAQYADAGVVLVADIDRGGVFASIIGTVELLTSEEREQLIGIIINKFRGDPALLGDGLAFIEQKTSRPVLGVVPMVRDLYIPGEDSVSLDRKRYNLMHNRAAGAAVGVIRLPHISNYTDFDPLEADVRFTLDYVTAPHRVKDYDAVILPGSKNVFYDLGFLRETGFEQALRDYHGAGGKIVGICGGYQMLGERIADPHGVEDQGGEINGLGLLPVCSIMEQRKITTRVRALFQLPGTGEKTTVEGYEIHMGRTFAAAGAAIMMLRSNENAEEAGDSARPDGLVWGTYVHGLFENDALRKLFLKWILPSAAMSSDDDFSYRAFKEENYDKLAAVVEQHVNVAYLLEKIGIDT
jgi:adenosylcobyric acid synthase